MKLYISPKECFSIVFKQLIIHEAVESTAKENPSRIIFPFADYFRAPCFIILIIFLSVIGGTWELLLHGYALPLEVINIFVAFSIGLSSVHMHRFQWLVLVCTEIDPIRSYLKNSRNKM